MQIVDTVTLVSLDAAKAYIAQLNLDYIIATMCAPSYPLPRWTLADATFCAKLYKNYLFLVKKHLPQNLVPTKEIDEFWHNHILHTKNYINDCMQIFGFYLHHEPANIASTDETTQLIKDFQNTKQLYLEEYQEPLTLHQQIS